jgi:hypothetical protein
MESKNVHSGYSGGFKEGDQIFQVRPVTTFDRVRLVIAIFQAGYTVHGPVGRMYTNEGADKAYKLWRKFPWYCFFYNRGDGAVQGYSKSFGIKMESTVPVYSVNEAMKWLVDNPGPYHK